MNTPTPPPRKTRVRRRLLTCGVLLLVVFVLTTPLKLGLARIVTGFGAKVLCAEVFLAGRDVESVKSEDLTGFGLGWLDYTVEPDRKRVTASLGPVQRTAIYRPGLGSTLVLGQAEDELRVHSAPAPPGGEDPRPWPVGDGLQKEPSRGIDPEKLEGVLDQAFLEPESGPKRGARAVVVLHRGRLVAERYAEGFHEHMPLVSWSLTKGLLSALVGVLVAQGRLDIHQPTGIAQWPSDDPRARITTDQLLRMSSGLRFSGVRALNWYGYAQMIFTENAADYAASQSLVSEPDTEWAYSTGSNIVSLVVRRAIGDDQEYLAFPRRALFDRIGMRSAVMEPDPAGTFVASSFSYATARDWARFGLLYLNDGVWEGERILPEGWVDYCRRPTPTAARGNYGAQWWLNAGPPGSPDQRPMPRLPSDYFAARGFLGQSVNVFPAQRLVVVRLGLTRSRGGFDLEAFLADVIGCLGD